MMRRIRAAAGRPVRTGAPPRSVVLAGSFVSMFPGAFVGSPLKPMKASGLCISPSGVGSFGGRCRIYF